MLMGLNNKLSALEWNKAIKSSLIYLYISSSSGTDIASILLFHLEL